MSKEIPHCIKDGCVNAIFHRSLSLCYEHYLMRYNYNEMPLRELRYHYQCCENRLIALRKRRIRHKESIALKTAVIQHNELFFNLFKLIESKLENKERLA